MHIARHCVLVMPDTLSRDRLLTVRAFGARVVLTPGARGMLGAVDRALQLVRELPHAFMLQQFSNPANPATHRATTAEEIWSEGRGQAVPQPDRSRQHEGVTRTPRSVYARVERADALCVDQAGRGDHPQPSPDAERISMAAH